MFKILLSTFLLIFYSCTPSADISENVEILTSGIFDPIEFTIQEAPKDFNLGEFVIGEDSIVLTGYVKNNTEFNLENLKLSIDTKNSNANMNFMTEAGAPPTSPGIGGTCTSQLLPGQSCTYKIFFNASFPGELTQKLTLNYSKLVNSETKVINLNLIAGEPASLIFATEQISYNLGVIERSDRTTKKTKLTLKNAGGLSARNITLTSQHTPQHLDTLNAFSVSNNTCPTILKKGEECTLEIDFTPMNWGIDAPDGDNSELEYISNFRFNYEKDSKGTQSSPLNSYFMAISATIEGKIVNSGPKQIEFDKIVVGNETTKIVKLSNDGYKEAILHHIRIKDSLNDDIAICVSNGSSILNCRDPSNYSATTANLSLPTFPFSIEDMSGCVANYSKLNYTRDSKGNISESSIRQVKGKTPTASGEGCFFKITFHPSTTYTSNGNKNGLKLFPRFDSTWKNNIIIKGDQGSDTEAFILSKAEYKSAAKLNIETFNFSTLPYTDLLTDNNNTFLFDLGRIALISDSAFKQALAIRVKNEGGFLAEITSITDGNNFTITEIPQDINDYYLDANHVGCTLLSANGGNCDIALNVSPIDQPSSLEEKNLMYDEWSIYPELYKNIIITYNDGTTLEDDGTVREPRTTTIKMRSLLIEKGMLAYSDLTGSEGNLHSQTTGSTTFYHLKLKNVGTGGIPFIGYNSNYYIDKLTAMNFDGPYPFEIIDRANGEDGADKDCFEIISPPDSHLTITPLSMTKASSILDPGEECSLTIKMNGRSIDRIPSNFYTSLTEEKKWEQYASISKSNTSNAWEWNGISQGQKNVSFYYADGDGIPNISTDFIPEVEGYGNIYSIAGATSGVYKIQKNFFPPAKLIPNPGKPSTLSVMWKTPMELPALTPTNDEWGQPLAASRLPAQYMNSVASIGEPPVAYWSDSEVYLKNEVGNHTDVDYILYAGTYPSNKGPFKASFNIKNIGYMNADSLNFNLSGDPEISIPSTTLTTRLTGGAEGEIDIEFSPTAAGEYFATVEITYENSATTLLNDDPYTISKDEDTLKVGIMFNAIPEFEKTIQLESQTYVVEYDQNADPKNTETLSAEKTIYPLMYFDNDEVNYPTLKGIKGSNLYSKKLFTITNTGTTTIDELNFNIKESISSTASYNTGTTVNYNVESNSCEDASILPGMTCTFEVKYQPTAYESGGKKFGAISYKMDSNQYTVEFFTINFSATDPAILKVLGVNESPVLDSAGTSWPCYKIDYGSYSRTNTNRAPVLSNYPTTTYNKVITITNSSVERASFLKQYQDYNQSTTATPPEQDWTKIYEENAKEVLASRSCFTGMIDSTEEDTDLWGFNSEAETSPVDQRCKLNIIYNFNFSHAGKDLIPTDNIIALKFYNNERSSTDTIRIVPIGFVEPNRTFTSTTATDIRSVYSDNQGNLNFEWTPFSITAPEWGDIVGYRVYYATYESQFSNVFTSIGINKVDVFTNSASITGLSPGTYYYVYITALRKEIESGLTYESANPDFDIREVVIPPENTFYDYERKIIIDKYLSPESGPVFSSKPEAKITCSSERLLVNKNNSITVLKKSLINLDIFNSILLDDFNSLYPVQAVSHWMDDDPFDISEFFPSFDSSLLNGFNDDVDNPAFYQKPCTDDSCNSLSVIKGGNGEDFPFNSTIYLEPEAYPGAARCYTNQ